MTNNLQFLEDQITYTLQNKVSRIIPKHGKDLLDKWASIIIKKGLEKEFSIEHEEKERGLTLAKSPIFIGGLPRSGTTLLRDLIDGHSEICVVPFEPLYYETCIHKLTGLNEDERFIFLGKVWLKKFVEGIGQPPFWLLKKDINGDSYAYVQFIEYAKAWWVVMKKEKNIGLYHREVIPFVLAFAMVSNEGKIDRKYKFWLEKSPGLEQYIDQLNGEFSNMHFIVCVRNPLKCFRSLKILMGKALNINAIPISEFYKSGLRYKSQLKLMHSNISSITIKHEELISDKKTVMKSLLAMCNLEWEPINERQTIIKKPAFSNTSYDKINEPALSRVEKEFVMLISKDISKVHDYHIPSERVNVALRFFCFLILKTYGMLSHSKSLYKSVLKNVKPWPKY